MKKIADRKLAVATTTVRALTPETLSQVVGGHPSNGIPVTPIAPVGNRGRIGR